MIDYGLSWLFLGGLEKLSVLKAGGALPFLIWEDPPLGNSA